MEIFNNHKKLFGAAFLLFLTLTIFVAILPALNNQQNTPLPGAAQLTNDALAGKHVFIANGCVSCHTQQVRNVEMDKLWGERPSVAADYATNTRMNWWMNTATLMGTERTGPDLTNIGNRLPSADWHLLHLYNPRLVVEESVMPAYSWMFEWKEIPGENDKIVNIPGTGKQSLKLVAKEEAMQLVAYLQSLKQTPLPDGTKPATFLYPRDTERDGAALPNESAVLNGELLYQNNCQACHQANGEGLKGAFPPLKGSRIVLDDDVRILIEIIMNGYNAREEYADMPAVGINNGLDANEITAIINHERSSWGNSATEVSADQVRDIMNFIDTETKKRQP